MENISEAVLYEGGPSQRSNWILFAGCAALFTAAIMAPTLWSQFFAHYIPNYKKIYMFGSKALFFISIFWAARAWLTVYCHKYKITPERLLERKGIFSRTTNEVEIFRVKDMTFNEPFLLRIFGCGDIILDTSDKSTPIVILHAIRNPRPLMEIIRKNVITMRAKKGVRELDM